VFPAIQATRAIQAVLVPRLAREAEHAATLAHQHRRDAQYETDLTHTRDRRLDRDPPPQDAALLLLLYLVQGRPNAGEDTHRPSLALVLHPRSAARLVKTLVRRHILAHARLLLVELLELEATLAHTHPLAAESQRETGATHAQQHPLVDVGRAILAHLLALYLVHALRHRKEQEQHVDALHPGLSLVRHHQGAQDLLSEMIAVSVVTPHLQKHRDPDRPLVAHEKPVMLLPAALSLLLRAPRWILVISIPVAGVC